MNTITLGVIGTGHLGRLHTKVLSENPAVTVAGVFDTDTEKGSAVAAEFSVPFYSSLDELLEKVQAVSIAVPTTYHRDVAGYCLQKKKPVFIEKPITTTPGQAAELIARAKENGVIIQVGHIERFNPALLSIEQFIANPKFIQTDRLAQFNPRGTDVAVVLDLMIHDIDIILSLIKSDVVKIDASGVAVVSESVDIANARLEFANGAVAIVTASRISQKKMRKMRIFEKDTYLSLDFTSGASEIFRLTDAEAAIQPGQISFGEIGLNERRKKVIYEQPKPAEVNALYYELDLFAQAVRDGKQPVVSGEDGMKALIVATEIMNRINTSSGLN